MPESSASAASPDAAAAWRALSSALSRKVVPVSSGVTIPKSVCGITSMSRAARSAANSRSLPALPLASTAFMGSAQRRDRLRLQREDLRQACRRQIQQGIQLMSAKGVAFGRALDFHEGAAAVHDHIHVSLGLRIFGVVQVQHRRAVAEPDRNRCDLTMQRTAVIRAPRLCSAAQACASAT